MNHTKTKIAAAGALTAATAVTIFAGVSSSSVGPAPTPQFQVSLASCTTDTNGLCTVPHTLGAPPEVVMVTPNTPGNFNAYILNTVLGSYTTTSFTVRAMFNQTTPKANGTIWFTYAVFAGGQTPPKTTPQPPTTTQPPQTTPTTTPGFPFPTTGR